MKTERVSLNGVMVYPFIDVLELLTELSVQKKILVAINAEKILHATEETRKIINENIGYADGIGAVMALKKKGMKNVIRIPGCELWLHIIKRFENEKSFYLVGGTQEVIEKTINKLRCDYPTINIVGYRNGYLKSLEERLALLEDIQIKKPDVVFVAMGSPKQELLMQEMQEKHIAIYQGLGGSFDVYTNTVRRAPRWWREHGLEWAYRLLRQPMRIKRQWHLFRYFYLLTVGKI